MLVASTVNSINSLGGDNDGVFKGLFRDSVYGICLKLKRHVLATHQELSILRRCAEMLQGQSRGIIHVVYTANKQKTNFIVNTLLHLGVSCGQIKVSSVGTAEHDAENIWLFVTEDD
ncbi:MAG: hypothetical protein AMJ53_13805 [Gammaproteobacteria bacterium SG8_11]|nr:MAG: hypothetical protein AMJ53_13805 [Gammaproteobacteria bacterium SG8_11]